MAEKVNEKKMREELIKIYQRFLNETDKNTIIDEAIAYDKKYGGLVSDHYIQHIPKDIAQAIGGLSVIYQHGMRSKDPGYSDKEIISRTKKILEDLKKEK